jgi:cysteine-rich repeat protein
MTVDQRGWIMGLGLWMAAAIGCEKPPESPAPPPAVSAAPAAAPEADTPRSRAALTGEVTDYHGRPLGGALVTARDDARAWNVSVFTDGNGHYAFPPLETGTYRVHVRQVGFERRERSIELPPEGLDVDFGSLRSAEDPHAQLPANYYFSLMNWPSAELRGNFALACANCHQIGDPLWRKPRTQAEWDAVVARMKFRGPPLLEEASRLLIPTVMEAFASGRDRDFALPPPPTGDATRAILWEYEVDPEGRNGCHDLAIGKDGSVITEDGFLLNPQTLERKHYPVPQGAHSIETGPDGNFFITVTGLDLMSKIDVASGKVTNYEHPQIGDDKGKYPHTLRFDAKGRIWYTLTVSNHVAMFDPKTEKFEYVDLPGAMDWKGPTPIPVAYGLDVAPDQSVWWTQLLTDTIGVIDPETRAVRSWKSPVKGPRRLYVGPDNVVWVPGYASSDLGRFDPKTEKWKVYPLPTEPVGFELPYALAVNRTTGDVWVAGSNSDTLIRFHPATEQWTIFPLATPVDFTREIEFDPQGNIWTCAPDRGTGPEGPLSGRFIKLQLLERQGSCGDKAVQLGEQCDDGNTTSGDGCSADCNLEARKTVAFKD